MAFVNEPDRDRTIDYGREAVLKRGGKKFRYYGAPGRIFTLSWKGNSIEFATKMETELLENDGSRANVRYLVEKCVYPKELEEQKSEIRQMIIEALATYGVHCGSREGTQVFVEIHPHLGGLN